MKMDSASMAAVLTAFSEMPVRMAAMERALTELSAKVEALRAASPPLLVPVTEAATIFRVSVPTVRRWVKSGRVPVVKVANTVRVDLSRVRGVDAEDIARTACGERWTRGKDPGPHAPSMLRRVHPF
jgi:excisionase family DNA binding protein